MDNNYYRNLQWSIQNDVTDLEYYFAIDEDKFGKRKEIDLIPNGRNIKVTNDNKLEYIEKLVFYKMYSEVSA